MNIIYCIAMLAYAPALFGTLEPAPRHCLSGAVSSLVYFQDDSPAVENESANINHSDADQGDLILNVASGVFREPEAADRDLDTRLEQAVARELNQRLGPGAGKAVGIDSRYIRHNLVVSGGLELRELTHPDVEQQDPDGDTVWYQKHAQLKLHDEFHDYAADRWEFIVQRSRLRLAALLGGTILTVLVIVFLCMRLNHATRGFYTGRLQWFAIILIALLLIAGLIVSRSFQWIQS